MGPKHMKSNKTISRWLATGLFLISGVVFAQVPDQNTPPDVLIKMVVSDVMASVKADPDIQKGNIPKVMELVEKKIVPFTDMRRTTEIAMGPNWKKATPEQQAILTAEFKTLLMRTYSGALSQLRDDKEVVVRTVVVGRGDPISLDYRLEKSTTGWKVYDMNIMGAWLVEAYRNQFTNQIGQNGIDGLVKFLQDRNKQLATTK
jgi:phospholipid transport system substrate-binding protein